MIRDILEKCVHDALLKESIVGADIFLEHPADLGHGDYSTNIAMVLAQGEGKSPREFAERVIAHIAENKPPEIERVLVAGGGFINFHLSRDFFTQSIREVIILGEGWGKNAALKGKKVMVEYTDPNPFKEFHIGHLMSNAVGESISRIVAFSGAEVKRVNYQGDIGLHVAKAIWGLRKAGERPDSVKTLGSAYARGAWAYEEDETAKAEITSINKAVYSREDSEINTLYDKGRALSLSYFEMIYEKLDTHFDHYFFESQSGVFGLETVREHKDVFEESDGAVVFRGDKHGLHTRVFVTGEGLPTYEAKELGIAKLKYDTYPYDLSIVVTDNEIVEYFKVVLKAMEQVFPELRAKTEHMSHGMMRLSSGKMSSRTGEVISAESLIGDVQNAALPKMRESDVPENEREAVAEQVAIGAIKYSILKQAAGRDIVFNMKQALSFEGDSGPYLQYAHTRALSVLAKASEKTEEIPAATARAAGAAASLERPVMSEERLVMSEVERMLYRFPEIIERAQAEYAPHYLSTYLTEVAGLWNTYYAKEKILDGSEQEPYKLALTKAVATTLKNGLHLLAIPTPERM